MRSEYRNLDQHLDGTVFSENNADALLEKAERKLYLGKVLDNQVLFRDLIDCLILLRFNVDLCGDSQMTLQFNQKINKLQKEAHLAVSSYPENFKNEVIELLFLKTFKRFFTF